MNSLRSILLLASASSGVRIAVVLNHASTLCLARIRKHAELVSADTPDTAFDLLRTGRSDAWASTRPALLEFSTKLFGSRVLEDCFGANFTAMAVPKGQPERLAYISDFIEEAKASGLVQRAIMHSGWRGVRMAVSVPWDRREGLSAWVTVPDSASRVRV